LNQNGIGTTYDVLKAIAYAKASHIPVLNISFGGTGSPVGNPVCEAITDAKNNGIITVVSAGNANADATNTIPAACPDAITVGATNRDDTKASFSNYGNGVDIYAPGVDIYTTALNNGYTTQNGTSFSAPLVTGLVAKELAYSGGISYGQILSDITNNYHLVTNSTLVNTITTST
jgi:subtilisin family serine protease